MHEHKHEGCCEHEAVKFCKKCGIPYCEDCGKEWAEKCNLNHFYWHGIYTYPNYTVTDVPYRLTTTSDAAGDITCFHTN